MLEYRQCKIRYEKGVSDPDMMAVLRKKAAAAIGAAPSELTHMRIVRKSLDARKKPELFYSYSIVFECRREEEILRRNRKNRNLSRYEPKPDVMELVNRIRGEERERPHVLIVGSGPAGLMCGYFLALCGFRPVLIERGGPMPERVERVTAFWKNGELDADTNVSFGEGGAGTFSDGKLNTGVKDRTGYKKFILDTFVRHGAPDEIRYLAKPHIGTDRLREVIQSMRRTIEECGGTYLFHTCFTGFVREDDIRGRGRLKGIRVTDARGGEQVMTCDACVLAIGHSARDTFERLSRAGIRMEQKPFAVGVRVEHPQGTINEAQYGFDDGEIPAADYKLTGRTGDGRGVYSFCMCPGGYVVNASTEDGMTVVNGMSDHARDSGRANSAVIVTVDGKDFGSSDALAGMEFQRDLERRAFAAGGGKIPVQRFADFKKGTAPEEGTEIRPRTKGRFVPANVKNILPSCVADGIIEGMRQFAGKIKGFDDGDTLILGTETRTSSPVRIVRDEELVCESLDGMYPCGEGAGYAGGIMSAAMDGLRVAVRIAEERKGRS